MDVKKLLQYSKQQQSNDCVANKPLHFMHTCLIKPQVLASVENVSKIQIHLKSNNLALLLLRQPITKDEHSGPNLDELFVHKFLKAVTLLSNILVISFLGHFCYYFSSV